jgi:hypothetical protein
MLEPLMREQALTLIRALVGGVVSDEVIAAELSRIACEADRNGRHGEAEALRAVCRNHRIRILEARAHIAMLEAEFGPLPD